MTEYVNNLNISINDLSYLIHDIYRNQIEGLGAYSAGKAAAEVLMKTLAVEEKENGVQVNLFDPINVATEGNPDGQHDPMTIARSVIKLIESEHMTKHGEIVKPEV